MTAGERRVELPLTLEILDFALPDAPSLPVMVYYESSQPRLYQGRDLDEVYRSVRAPEPD